MLITVISSVTLGERGWFVDQFVDKYTDSMLVFLWVYCALEVIQLLCECGFCSAIGYRVCHLFMALLRQINRSKLYVVHERVLVLQ